MEGGLDYLRDKGWDKEIEFSKVYHINNGVDLEVFDTRASQCHVNDATLGDSTLFKVIYVGSMGLANNVQAILDAALVIQRLGVRDVKFLIYGDGSDRPRLEQYCLQHGINNVQFQGVICKEKVPYVLSMADLNVMHFDDNPLKKYGPSLNKMFEYFASGKPTVSDCRFSYDLIERYRCGISQDTPNPADFAANILKFYRMSKDEYRVYGHNARIAAKAYDLRILAGKMESMLLELRQG